VGQNPRDCGVALRLISDPPGRTEAEAGRRLCVAIHVGRAVHMACERAGFRHSGLLVHGDIDIIPAFTPSVWEPEERDTALAIGVSTRLLNAAAENCGMESGELVFTNRFQIRDPQIENIGWAMKAEMEAGYPSGPLYLESLGMALAARLVQCYSSSAERTGNGANGVLVGRRLKLVLSYIEENLARDLSLDAVAAVAGVGTSHFKAIFRQALGVPVHQYILQRRVEHARVLLTETEAGIKQVALDCGFAHQSHMAAQMRRILGCSPKAIRGGQAHTIVRKAGG
jgi:AraC family transcriptional regulator